MKTIEVHGKLLRSGGYCIRSAREVETGIEVNTPSLLVNLIRLRGKLREPLNDKQGFEYTFPMVFSPSMRTNGFKATFPIIFE